MEPITDAVQNSERFIVRTPRLDLRPFESGDAVALHALFSKAGVRKYLLDDAIMPLAWVEGEIRGSSVGFAKRGFGLWRVGLHSGPMIGFAGYREFHDPPELQLLCGLDPDFWNRGYATEASAAVISYGFDAIGMAEVVASTDAANVASLSVMERLGMRYQKREVKGGLDTIYYVLTQSQWRDPAPHRLE